MGDLGTGLDWTGANSWCCSRSAIPSRDNPISFHFLILFFSETPSSFDYFPFFFRLLLLRDECSHVLKNKNLRGKRKKEFSARLTHTFSSFYRFLCMICARDAMRCDAHDAEWKTTIFYLSASSLILLLLLLLLLYFVSGRRITWWNVRTSRPIRRVMRQ